MRIGLRPATLGLELVYATQIAQRPVRVPHADGPLLQSRD